MKRTILSTVILSISALCLAADGVAPKRTRPRGSAPSGGIVEKAYSGNVVRIVNAQSAVSAEKVASCVRDIRLTSLLPFEVVDGLPGSTSASDAVSPDAPEEAPALPGNLFSAASAVLNEPNVGASILIVEEPSLPLMLVSPESRWTILNVAFLKTDSPSKELLEERFGKVLWCAAARTLGAGYSSYRPCVLEPFSDLRGLDRIRTSKPCPEPFNKMIDTGAALGIRTLTIASYRTACTQGWAPSPTNDVQRAIWEQVSADKERGPTNTRPIKFRGRRPPRP